MLQIKFNMYKSVVVLCVVFAVVIEARPKWQYLPKVDGYVPVYIQAGETPLDEINPELAEAFHALPAGRSSNKQIEASPEIPELADQPSQDVPVPDEAIDRRPYEKNVLEKKEASEITKPVERR